MFIKKIICFVMVVGIVACTLIGCGDLNANNESYDDYSCGLEENGLYKNLDQYDYDPNELYSLSFTCEEVLAWGVESAKSSGNSNIETIDDYVYLYGEELLAALGFTNKDIVEEGDFVSASLEFAIDGEQLADYSSTSNYEASVDGDAIVSSFVGHNVKDVYEVEYVFPEDADEHALETAVVTVTINSVSMPHPIENGVVEEHLDEIGELLDGVIDAETYLLELRPKLASSTLELFIENYLQTADVPVPDEYIEYEVYRLKARLQQIGYDYNEYLAAVKMTDDEVREYCAMVARENYMIMKMYSSMDHTISEEDLNGYYGDGYESIENAQGLPYMKLNIIRELAIYEITSKATLTDNDGNVIETVEVLENDVEDGESSNDEHLESTASAGKDIDDSNIEE